MNEVDTAIEIICAPETAGGLPGWCTPTKGLWLANTIVREHLTHIVEIGVFGGRSLLSMGLAVKYLDRGGYVLGLDPYEFDRQVESVSSRPDVEWAREIPFESIYARALQELRSLGLSGHCGILRSAADDVATLIGPLDLLHIDGCHSILASCRDVEVWAPKVRPGGLVVLDDCEWPSVQVARAMLAALCEPPVAPEPGWKVYRKK